MDGTLEMLLALEPPKLPTCKVKLKRLSELCDGEVVFELKALPYNRVAEIKEMLSERDMSIHILLAGIISPDLKSGALMEKYAVPTPDELIKAILLPGEIEDLSRKVEKLSGYRTTTIEDIKKK